MFDKQQLENTSRYSVRVIKANCNMFDAADTSLPRNSYIVTAIHYDGSIWYDIVQGKLSDIFDFYHDNLPGCIQKYEWTEGKINPKLWTPPKGK